jgi:RimJ/RimL family protein N-acetyltransferase
MTVRRRTLETSRLRLRPLSTAHAAAIHEAVLASRAELLPWMPWAREPTISNGREEAVRGRRAWDEDREFHFMVGGLTAGRALGVVGVTRTNETATAELSYWIRSDHAGQGLATEACRALIEWVPDALGVRRLTLWAGRDNLGSRRVAAKLGFAHTGPLGWRPAGGLGTFEAEAYELKLATAPHRDP